MGDSEAIIAAITNLSTSLHEKIDSGFKKVDDRMNSLVQKCDSQIEKMDDKLTACQKERITCMEERKLCQMKVNAHLTENGVRQEIKKEDTSLWNNVKAGVLVAVFLGLLSWVIILARTVPPPILK